MCPCDVWGCLCVGVSVCCAMGWLWRSCPAPTHPCGGWLPSAPLFAPFPQHGRNTNTVRASSAASRPWRRTRARNANRVRPAKWCALGAAPSQAISASPVRAPAPCAGPRQRAAPPRSPHTSSRAQRTTSQFSTSRCGLAFSWSWRHATAAACSRTWTPEMIASSTLTSPMP